MTDSTSRSRRVLAAAASGAAVLAALPVALLAPTAAHAADGGDTNRYIIMNAAKPLATYGGGLAGLPATAPDGGDGVVTDSAAATKYQHFLDQQQRDSLVDAGLSPNAIDESFKVAFNGYTAELTAAEAAALQSAKGVANVWKDEVRYGETVSTPDFLGLSGRRGVWNNEFGGQQNAGRGIIVGVIDSGIWPENPSFAPLVRPRDQRIIDAKWHGTCDTGTEEPIACNNKLIGARYYVENNKVEDFEFNSPRDYNGHGSHTAATAAGNMNVPATINNEAVGTASGVAPAARIAAYKVLWATPDGRASGTTAGIVHAIDDAVADGVDVINYSISGSTDYIVSPDEVAFLNAADAGVFISASAGNSGDAGPSTVAHNSPWEMTVAASTHDRGSKNGVKLGNGATYPGVGVSVNGVGPAPLVVSETVAAAGAAAAEARLCFPGTLDAAKVAGKIVVCSRGVNARVEKSQTVKDAGGIGMILANASDAQDLAGDYHVIPTSHVNATNGAAIKAYATSTAAATATILPRETGKVRAPEMAGFSSYGPALAGGGDLLKPDITAPGVNVIAAVSPAGNAGNNFNSYSGTSMSAPHVAGLAALLISRHPDWSPTWVKSALMTTATDRDNSGAKIQRAGKDATPLDYGNGHVVPAKSFQPGLVYDNTTEEWLQYGCGIGQLQLLDGGAICDGVGAIDPSNLNYPSIAVSGLAGQQTVTRRVTSTLDRPQVWRPRVTAPAGFTASVSPQLLYLRPGQTASYSIKFTRTSAPMEQWAFGDVTWIGGAMSVRSAIALKPVALSSPAEITGSGVEGAQDVSVVPGYTGTLKASVAGLVPAEVKVAPTTKDVNSKTTFEIPAGTKVVRFATYDADYPAGTDLDLTVKDSEGHTIGTSGGATSQETVTLTGDDLGGTYIVEADYFAGDPETLNVMVNGFAVGDTDAGNLTVTPAEQPVTIAKPASVKLAWTGLEANTRYLGRVNFTNGTDPVGSSLVSINP